MIEVRVERTRSVTKVMVMQMKTEVGGLWGEDSVERRADVKIDRRRRGSDDSKVLPTLKIAVPSDCNITRCYFFNLAMCIDIESSRSLVQKASRRHS